MLIDPVIRNYTVPLGTTYPIRMRWLTANSIPIDLTGYNIVADLKKNFNDAVGAYPCTLINGKSYLDSNNIFGFTLDQDTSSLLPGRYYYDLYVISQTNDSTRAMQGIITLTPRVASW